MSNSPAMKPMNNVAYLENAEANVNQQATAPDMRSWPEKPFRARLTSRSTF